MKEQFPLFAQYPDLVYLDNGATVQKPNYVLDEINHFLTHDYANIHRGSYPLAIQAEEAWDHARYIVAQALGANDQEIIFTANATHSSNLLAWSFFASGMIGPGDIIVVGVGDHHANILPWQVVAERAGATVAYVGYDPQTWAYDRSVFDSLDVSRIKIVAVTLVSNVTGTIANIDFVKKLSKNCKMSLVVDASQAVPHMLLDVHSLGADMVYFTGHKLGALTGIGVLRGKKELLASLQPAFVGGGAVEWVTTQGHTYQPAPDKFEPGTPNVVGAVSLRASFERIASLASLQTGSRRESLARGYEILAEREQQYTNFCCETFTSLQSIGKIQMVGSLSPTDRIGLFSFTLPQGDTHKLGLYLGSKQICVRTGAHCTHPFHTSLGVSSTARISLWAYNDMADIQRFFSALDDYLQK